MAIATMYVATGCGAESAGSSGSLPPTDSAVISPIATASSAPSPTASSVPESTDSCGSATISIDYAPYTTATLAGYGWEFVVADVVGFDAAIFNTPDGSRPPGFGTRPSSPYPNHNAETLIYTPVNVVIDHAISGPSRPGPGQFLVEGGTVGCFTMWVSPTPSVKSGSRYVFILSEALDSQGEKPLPLRKARFAWPVNPAETVTTPDGPMSMDGLSRIVTDATPSNDIGRHARTTFAHAEHDAPGNWRFWDGY